MAPGSSASVVLAAAAVPGTATAGATFQGTLTLTSNDPTAASSTLSLTETPTGATLSLTPASVDFGTAFVGQPAANIAVTLRNSGNAAAAVTFGASTDAQFGVQYPGSPASTSVAANGGELTGLEATFLPNSTNPSTGTLAVQVAGAVCGQSASTLAVSGRGSSDAVLVSGNLDFGNVFCGQTAAAKTVTVTNTTSQPFDVTTALQGNAGFTITPATATVARQSTVTFTVTPPAIPAAVASLPGSFGDRVQITTNIPNDAPRFVDIAMGAKGSIFTFDPAQAAFGNVPVGSSQATTVTVRNLGNEAASTTLALGSGSGNFSATPLGLLSVGPASSVQSQVTFTPSNITAQSNTLEMRVDSSTVLCQPLPSPVALSGTGQNGGIALSDNTLDFGLTNCGAQAAPKSFTVTNSGNVAVNFTGALAQGANYVASCAPSAGATASTTCAGDATTGAIAPGESVTVTISPYSLPATSAVTAGLYDSSFDLRSDVVGDAQKTITLKQSPQGVILEASIATIDFGQVPANTTVQQAFGISNAGNVAVDVQVAVDNAFFAVPAGAQSTAAGASSSFNASFSPGLNTAAQTGLVTLTVPQGTALCRPLPSPALTLNGQGQNGAVAFSPGSLDFGLTNCGATAGAKQIVFANNGNADYSVVGYTLTKGANSPFDVVLSNANGLVAQGSTLTVTVTPKAIPGQVLTLPGDFSDTLTLTTDAAGDSPHDIALSQGAKGVILSVASNALVFGNVPVGERRANVVSLLNQGNVGVTIGFTAINGTPFTFDQNVLIGAGTSVGVNGFFEPPSVGTFNGSATLSIPQGTVACQPLPNTAFTMNGSGTATSTIRVTPTTVAFGKVDCGTAATARTFVIQNTAVASADFSLAVTGPFTVSPSSGTVAGQSSVPITVTPDAIPVTTNTSLTNNAYGGSVELTTTAPNDNTRTISFTQSAQGAVLTFSSNQYNIARNGSPVQVRVNNTGNKGADVKMNITQGQAGAFAFSPTPTTPNTNIYFTGTATAGSNISYGVVFTRTNLEVCGIGNARCRGTVTASVPQDTVLCRPIANNPSGLQGN